jgi:hypothetical protein
MKDLTSGKEHNLLPRMIANRSWIVAHGRLVDLIPAQCLTFMF